MKSPSDLARCGNNLRLIREKRRITVDALAALSGVSAETINHFEKGGSGDITIIDLLNIAEVLDIDLTDIFTGHRPE